MSRALFIEFSFPIIANPQGNPKGEGFPGFLLPQDGNFRSIGDRIE